jgi:hypothetical protein
MGIPFCDIGMMPIGRGNDHPQVAEKLFLEDRKDGWPNFSG